MPSGFQQGKDYTGLVGDDLYAMGQKTADNLAKAMRGEVSSASSISTPTLMS
jgi:hypothetical protein